MDRTGRSVRLVLLGTKGGPRVGGIRGNPSNLLLIDDQVFVIDCGYGVARAIVNAGIRHQDIGHIFITHHHSDHNLEFGNLVNNAWSTGLAAPIRAYGPKGLADMAKAYWELNKIDVAIRIHDEGKPDPRGLLDVTDIEEGIVLDTPAVKVTAMRVPHPPVIDNFAYRFETRHGVIVFSSDTIYHLPLAEFAKGADILLHEAMYEPGVDKLAARVPNAVKLKQHLMGSHSTTDEVGRIAAIARPRLLVLNHLVPGDDPEITDEMWLAGVRRHYDGAAVVGRDLMAFDLPLT